MNGIIQGDANWYLAEIVVTFRVEGEEESVVHINFILINAVSSAEAYRKALAFGSSANVEYQNSDGKTVFGLFRGLRDLHMIYEPLEDGAELLFENHGLLIDSEIQERHFVRPKRSLNVFRKRRVRRLPGSSLKVSDRRSS